MDRSSFVMAVLVGSTSDSFRGISSPSKQLVKMHDKLRNFISSSYRLRSLIVPRFQPADLEDERQLIADLWLDSQSRNAVEMLVHARCKGLKQGRTDEHDASFTFLHRRTCLRRGELSKGLKLCAESGQVRERHRETRGGNEENEK